MPRHFRNLFVTLALATCLVGRADCEAPATIEEGLGCLTDVSFKELPLPPGMGIPSDYRQFELQITQPIDHFDRSLGSFSQKLVLLHKSLSEPMVLQTSGYKIFSVRLSGIALTFQTNQLQVEHRFFDQSTPDILDWSKLDILQSAHDFHRVTEELKKIYKGNWVNNGASKGGMTSVYHRRFFPEDVSGTVADVAPLSFSTEDERYVSFVEGVGGPAYKNCRNALFALQSAMFRRRHELLPLVTGSFVFLGGKNIAFDHAVVEMPFVFWQYKSPADVEVGCAKVPGPYAPVEEVAEFLSKVNPVEDYGDTNVLGFMPYYFQAATQLGSPAAGAAILSQISSPYSIDQYTPPGVKYTYSNAMMRDVESWVKTKANNILFIYGELDPWSAAAFPKSDGATDFHWMMNPGGNHSSSLLRLSAPLKAKAINIIGAWLGKEAPSRSLPEYQETLEAAELSAKRIHHLP